MCEALLVVAQAFAQAVVEIELLVPPVGVGVYARRESSDGY